MGKNYYGKHVTIDPMNPQALGVCDYSGTVHLRKDLVKQMQWVGESLVWTGLYVGPDYLDEPNPQMRTSNFPIDPKPVIDPRPQQYFDPGPPQEIPDRWQS